AGAEAEGLVRALHVDDVHRLELDVEELLDRGLDVGLGRILGDFKRVLVGEFLQARGLFGHAGRADHLVELRLVHASHSSIFFTASVVISTLSAPTSATGSRPCTSRISTYGRLRADRYRCSDASSVTISGRLPRSNSLSLATRPLVLVASTSNASTTTSRPCRLSSDRIEAIAARYILRLTFCPKLRGLAANVTPPPRKIGAVRAPWRAPPPFCFFDFLVVPDTSERVFCALVPARPALRYATTTWWTRSRLNSRPNTTSETDTLLLLPVIESSIAISLMPCSRDARSRLRPARQDPHPSRRSGRARRRPGPPGGSACSAAPHPCGRTSSCPGTRDPASAAGRSNPANGATASCRASRRPC